MSRGTLCIARDDTAYPIVKSYSVFGHGPGYFSCFPGSAVTFSPSLERRRVGLPKNVAPLHWTWESQFDINPLVQRWGDWNLSNVVFRVNV